MVIFSKTYLFREMTAYAQWTLYSCREKKGENEKGLRKAEKNISSEAFSHVE